MGRRDAPLRERAAVLAPTSLGERVGVRGSRIDVSGAKAHIPLCFSFDRFIRAP
jgi:hypothetical protein